MKANIFSFFYNEAAYKNTPWPRKKEKETSDILGEYLFCLKRFRGNTIDQNRVGYSCDTTRNPPNKLLRETNLTKNCFKKTPFNRIISFGYINFNHTTRANMRPIVALNKVNS